MEYLFYWDLRLSPTAVRSKLRLNSPAVTPCCHQAAQHVLLRRPRRHVPRSKYFGSGALTGAFGTKGDSCGWEKTEIARELRVHRLILELYIKRTKASFLSDADLLLLSRYTFLYVL